MTEPTNEEAAQAAAEFNALVQEATVLFFSMAQERHTMGEKKYGPVKFVEANTYKEAMEEVADLANYAMYAFIKLYILDKQVQQMIGEQPEMLGASTFMKG
jgi:hypothetical protein